MIIPGDGDRRIATQEEEAIAISGRLAETSSTASPAQLRELLNRYEMLLRGLEEADEAWLKALQHGLHASSA